MDSTYSQLLRCREKKIVPLEVVVQISDFEIKQYGFRTTASHLLEKTKGLKPMKCETIINNTDHMIPFLLSPTDESQDEGRLMRKHFLIYNSNTVERKLSIVPYISISHLNCPKSILTI